MKTTHPNQSRNMIATILTLAILLTVILKTCGQCVTQTALNPLNQFYECWTAPLLQSDEYTVTCPIWYDGGGFVYEFFSDGQSSIVIYLESNLYYTFAPNGQIWCHAFITDECNGQTVWGSSSGCITDPSIYVGLDTTPGFEWILSLVLPEGYYYLHIGNVGIDVIQGDIEGCMDLTIESGFLGLNILRHYQEDIIFDPWKKFDFIGRRY
tara:strand:+ start:1577 stop:2206 length:630 start_codon:yes stop_codon:yes gene_type:complete